MKLTLYCLLKPFVVINCFKQRGILSLNIEAEYLKVNFPKLVLIFGL